MQYGWCPYKKRNIWSETQTHKEENHVNMEAELKCCWHRPGKPQESQQTPGARGNKDALLEVLDGTKPADAMISNFPLCVCQGSLGGGHT